MHSSLSSNLVGCCWHQCDWERLILWLLLLQWRRRESAWLVLLTQQVSFSFLFLQTHNFHKTLFFSVVLNQSRQKCRLGASSSSRMEGVEPAVNEGDMKSVLVEMIASVNFSSKRQLDSFNLYDNSATSQSIIFGPGGQTLLIGIYCLIFILGLISNAAMIWVILGKSFNYSSFWVLYEGHLDALDHWLFASSLCIKWGHVINAFSGRKQNRNPRNMYIANLSIAGIVMTLFCIPPTLLQILFGGWWHLGVVACKLVPVIQGKCFFCQYKHTTQKWEMERRKKGFSKFMSLENFLPPLSSSTFYYGTEQALDVKLPVLAQEIAVLRALFWKHMNLPPFTHLAISAV